MLKKCGFADDSERLLKNIEEKLNAVQITEGIEQNTLQIVKARIYCRLSLVKIIYSSAKMVDETDHYLRSFNHDGPVVLGEQKLAIAELYDNKARYLLMRAQPEHRRIMELCDMAEAQLKETKYNRAFIYKTRLLCQIDLGKFAEADAFNENFFELIDRGLERYSSIRYYIDKAKICIGMNKYAEALDAIHQAMFLAKNIPKRKVEAMVYCAVIHGLLTDYDSAAAVIKAIYAQAKVKMVRGSFMAEIVAQFERAMDSITQPIELFDLYINKIYQCYSWINGEHYCDTKYFKMCLNKWQLTRPADYKSTFSQNWFIFKAASSALGAGFVSLFFNSDNAQDERRDDQNVAIGSASHTRKPSAPTNNMG